MGTLQRQLQRCAVWSVSHQQISDTMRDDIHRTIGKYAEVLKTMPSAILQRAEQPRFDDFDIQESLPVISALNSSAPTGRKRNRSPGRSRLGTSSSGRNKASGVLPMIFQPPGVASGYTPV